MKNTKPQNTFVNMASKDHVLVKFKSFLGGLGEFITLDEKLHSPPISLQKFTNQDRTLILQTIWSQI